MRQLRHYTVNDFKEESQCLGDEAAKGAYIQATSANFDEVEALLEEIKQIPFSTMTNIEEVKLLILELKEREQLLKYYFKSNFIFTNFPELFERPLQELQSIIDLAESKLKVLEAKARIKGNAEGLTKDWSELKNTLVKDGYFQEIDSKYFNALMNGQYHIIPEKDKRPNWKVALQGGHFCNHLGIEYGEIMKYFKFCKKDGTEKRLNKTSVKGDTVDINEVLFRFGIEHAEGKTGQRQHKRVAPNP